MSERDEQKLPEGSSHKEADITLTPDYLSQEWLSKRSRRSFLTLFFGGAVYTAGLAMMIPGGITAIGGSCATLSRLAEDTSVTTRRVAANAIAPSAKAKSAQDVEKIYGPSRSITEAKSPAEVDEIRSTQKGRKELTDQLYNKYLEEGVRDKIAAGNFSLIEDLSIHPWKAPVAGFFTFVIGVITNTAGAAITGWRSPYQLPDPPDVAG